jgi:hypothetical protein
MEPQLETDKKQKSLDELSDVIMMLKYIYEENVQEKIIENFNSQNNETKEVINHTIFKKISMIFKSLKKLFKFLIVQVDEEKYQKSQYDDIKFPQNIDHLTLIIGSFDKAFNNELAGLLYSIVNFDNYADFLCISQINASFIPFVADDSINTDKLINDFNAFKLLVRDFACEVLNVNVNFEPNIFEDI